MVSIDAILGNWSAQKLAELASNSGENLPIEVSQYNMMIWQRMNQAGGNRDFIFLKEADFNLSKHKEYANKLLKIYNMNDFANVVAWGIILFNMNLNDQAALCFQAIIDFDVIMSNPWNIMGVILLRDGKDEEAVEYFRWAVKLDSNNKDAQDNLKLFSKNKKLDILIKYSTTQAKSNINSLDPFFKILRDCDLNVLQTRLTINELLAIHANYNLDKIFTWGVDLIALNKNSQAKLCFETVIRRNECHSEAWNYMGILLLRNGQNEQANDYFLKAVALDENNKSAKENLKLLSEEKKEEILKKYNVKNVL